MATIEQRDKFVIALDQGTTSSRAVLINHEGCVVDFVQRPFQQIYPHPGWVEHNPQDILFSQIGALTELITKHGLDAQSIDSIGIDNQRETTLVWDPTTGAPVCNAIVWQCRRTSELVEQLCGSSRVQAMIREKCGLLADAYFSASKIRWILDNVAGARERAEAGELLFGTVDTWLIWVLTGGLVHATDTTNASRTMLYNIHEGCWDKDLLSLFDIPESMLPEVRASSSFFGETSYPGLPAGIPLTGVAGDQQAALFGQCCFEPGQAKNTYGTGCFMLLHTGTSAHLSKNNLVTTIVASPPTQKQTEYALEGSVFVAGALIQWLRDELGLIQTAEETSYLAKSVPHTGGVYIVPAFTGLGAPWWQPDARGTITGITRGTTRAHIVRAALEALAYQIKDLADAMSSDCGQELSVLNVDGGAARNNFLMQFQADVLGCTLKRPQNTETTALGAAYLAGLSTGYWSGTEELKALRQTDDLFVRKASENDMQKLIDGWHRAVQKAI